MKKTLFKLLAATFPAAGLLASCMLLASCEQEIERNSGSDSVPGLSNVPSGVVTGDLTENLGMSVTISVTVGGDGGSRLLDNGVIVCPRDSFTLASTGIMIVSADTAVTGSFTVTVTGLSKNTAYYCRAYSLNANGIAYGDIRPFTTIDIIFSPYTSDFAPHTAAVDGWVFDRYTGYDPDGVDPVWFSLDIGTTSVASFCESEAITLVSPAVRIASPADTLSFYFYAGAYGSPQTRVKVYVTENLNDYGDPVKDWTLTSGGGRTAIPLDGYTDKTVYAVIVIEEGDFILYRFSIAPTTLFPEKQ